MRTEHESTEKGEDAYKLRISRLTIDKLGVKLYDKVSAALAEVIANSFDADAETVTISLPLSTALCTKRADGSLDEKGFQIEIKDDGHGMTPEEAKKFYLYVGKDRRNDPERGEVSREKRRPVMGRKGIGKLAPFGICKQIEVVSAGGDLVPDQGYLVSHFFLDFDRIIGDTDEEIILDKGELDRTFASERGTTIKLTNFNVKTVPNRETFQRQIATRFLFVRPDFNVDVTDIITNSTESISTAHVDFHESTLINLADRPVTAEDGEVLPVTGWLAMAKQSYKNNELAGVRIYARGKFVAQTRDFEQPAGFTGEFTVRSYLVGEVVADWLDEREDLIRSDRQGILWESEYGQALRMWGANLIKEIGSISKEPRREKKKKMFMEKSDFVNLARERFAEHPSVADVAINLAEMIGEFAAEDELEDAGYVQGLSEVILMVAPHKALIDALQEFGAVVDRDTPVEDIVNLFDKTRVAEMAAYARIAAERVEAIEKLQHIVITEPNESEFQKLLADAPWLIEPSWSVISGNQALASVKVSLERFIKNRLGEEVVFAIGFEDFRKKRPDFTLASIDGVLHIVEIKRSGHVFNDADFKRFANYPAAFEEFFAKNVGISSAFPNGWRITLITDDHHLEEPAYKMAYRSLKKEGQVVEVTWDDFLLKAKTTHEKFMNVKRSIDADEAAESSDE